MFETKRNAPLTNTSKSHFAIVTSCICTLLISYIQMFTYFGSGFRFVGSTVEDKKACRKGSRFWPFCKARSWNASNILLKGSFNSLKLYEGKRVNKVFTGRTHSRTHARTHARTHSRKHARKQVRTHAQTHSLTHKVEKKTITTTTTTATRAFEVIIPLPLTFMRTNASA